MRRALPRHTALPPRPPGGRAKAQRVLAGASQTAAYVVSSKAAAASVQSVVEGKATTAAAVGDTAKLHADATAKFGSLAGAAAVLDTLK